MILANPRLRRVSIAATFLIFAAGPAAAEPPPPAGPSPLPMPYPNTEPEGGEVAAHKHIAGVKYEDFATSTATMEPATAELSDGAAPVQVIGLSWGKLDGAGPVYSADPMEGGQVTARTYRPGRPTYGNVTMESSASSARMTTSEPGKLEVPNMVAEPVARGTASFKTLAGLCATGKHLVKVKITTRSSGFTLHDATVISVIPADPVDGQAMEQVTLSYASLDD